jgi:hypothetical protein
MAILMRKWPWQQVAKPIELDTDLEACFGRDFLIFSRKMDLSAKD